MNPLRVAKLVGVVILMLGAATASHKLTKGYYVQKQLEEMQAQQAQYEESVQQYKDSVSAQKLIVKRIEKTNRQLADQLRKSVTQREEEIKNAVQTANANRYSLAFGWVWNDSICRSNRMPGCPDDTTGVARDQRDSDLTSQKLLRNHTEIVGQLAQCKANLGKIKRLHEEYQEYLQSFKQPPEK